MFEGAIFFMILTALLITLYSILKGKNCLRLQHLICMMVLVQLLVPISFNNADFSHLNVAEGAAKATLKVTEATDNLLIKYASYNKFTVTTDKYAVPVLFTTDKPLRNFRLFTLTWDQVAEKMVYVQKDPLYQQNMLTPEKPLVVYMSFPGSMPPVGIDFIDADGTTRSYQINQSGYDGSILLEKPYQAN